MKWHTVALTSDLQEGEGKTVDVFGKPIALFNDGGTFKAVENTCPHRRGSLGEGTLQNGCVVCPLHQWTFNLETGENIRNPQVKLSVYPVRVEGEKIRVAL